MNPEMPSLGAAQAFAIGLEADLEAGMRGCEQDQLPDDLVSLGRLLPRCWRWLWPTMGERLADCVRAGAPGSGKQARRAFSLSIQARYETFAEASAALERSHHGEDVSGSRCACEFGRFSSLARLCWSAL